MKETIDNITKMIINSDMRSDKDKADVDVDKIDAILIDANYQYWIVTEDMTGWTCMNAIWMPRNSKIAAYNVYYSTYKEGQCDPFYVSRRKHPGILDRIINIMKMNEI